MEMTATGGGATKVEKRDALLDLENKDAKEIKRVDALLEREKSFELKKIMKAFADEMKEEKKVERRKRMAARKRGRRYGKPEKMMERTQMPLVLEWIAHMNTAVKSIQFVDDPDFNYKWVVTTGGDKSSKVWRIEDSSYVAEEEEEAKAEEAKAAEEKKKAEENTGDKAKRAGVLTEEGEDQAEEGGSGDGAAEGGAEGEKSAEELEEEREEREAAEKAKKEAEEKAKKKKEKPKTEKEKEEEAAKAAAEAAAKRVPVTAEQRREAAKQKRLSGKLEDGELRPVKIGEMLAGSQKEVNEWRLNINMQARRRRQLEQAAELQKELVAEEEAERIAAAVEEEKRRKLRAMQGRKNQKAAAQQARLKARAKVGAAAAAAAGLELDGELEGEEDGLGADGLGLDGFNIDDQDDDQEEPQEAALMESIARIREQEVAQKERQRQEERRLLEQMEEEGGGDASGGMHLDEQPHQRGFRRCPAGVKRKLGREKLAGPPAEERLRLLRQLSGTTTWIETQHEIATKEAAKKEGKKQARAARLAEKKARRKQGKKVFDPYNVLGNGPTGDGSNKNDNEVATLLDDVEGSKKKGDDAGGPLSLPELVPAGGGAGGKHKDLDQKQIMEEDNWEMGSFNRSREMYWHLSSEQRRLAEKMEARAKRQNSTQPSDFLKKHLGKYANGTPQEEKTARRSVRKSADGGYSTGRSAVSSRLAGSHSAPAVGSESADDVLAPRRRKKRQPPSAEEAIASFVQQNRPAILTAGPNVYKQGRNMGAAGRSESVTTLGRHTAHGHNVTNYRHNVSELSEAEAFRLKKRVQWLGRQPTFGKYHGDAVRSVKSAIEAALEQGSADSSHEIDDDIDLKAFLDNGGGGACGGGVLRKLQHQIANSGGNYVGMSANDLLELIFPDAEPKVRRDVLDFVTLERRLDMMTVKGKEEEDAGPEVKLSAATKRELKELFRLYDQDGNGTIDMDELTYALQSGVMGSLGVSKNDILALMSQFDTDGDNVLSEAEFIQVFKDLI
eukprot:g882.t1